MFPEAPMIVRETSNGYFRYSIEEDMLSKREVECVGEITPESAYSIARAAALAGAGESQRGNHAAHQLSRR